MKRYHAEKHILEKRAKQRRQLDVSLGVNTPYKIAQGRFRKALRCSGCTRARCQVCHPEKYPKRIPTRQERQSYRDDE